MPITKNRKTCWRSSTLCCSWAAIPMWFVWLAAALKMVSCRCKKVNTAPTTSSSSSAEPYYLVLEYISMGKLLSFLRHHRKDGANYFEADSDLPPLTAVIHNNNYLTYCNNNAYGYSEINHNRTQPTALQENLVPFDLIQFAYQISKGMEFISSHGVGSLKQRCSSFIRLQVSLTCRLFTATWQRETSS